MYSGQVPHRLTIRKVLIGVARMVFASNEADAGNRALVVESELVRVVERVVA